MSEGIHTPDGFVEKAELTQADGHQSVRIRHRSLGGGTVVRSSAVPRNAAWLPTTRRLASRLRSAYVNSAELSACPVRLHSPIWRRSDPAVEGHRGDDGGGSVGRASPAVSRRVTLPVTV